MENARGDELTAAPANMTVSPDRAEFERAFAEGRGQVVWTRIVADLDTPVSAWLKLGAGEPYSFLLESVQGGEIRGRFSIIGVRPDLVWRVRGTVAEISRNPLDNGPAWTAEAQHPLDSLRSLVRSISLQLPAELPPMAAGVFGYLGYDMVRLMERLPAPNPDPIGLDDAIMIRPTIIAIFDALKADVILASPVWPERGSDANAAYDAAIARLDKAVADFGNPMPSPPVEAQNGDAEAVVSNTTHADYLSMVAKAKEYIAAGDAFQIVPSQRFRRRFAPPPFSLYRSLRRLNPSPFLYYLKFPGFSVVGSCPEILVRLRDETVTVRPIAGTAPRGATRGQDEDLAASLLADPKERAEHLMLLDLGRNDVGRVAHTGTVKVTEQFVVERYSHVMHIVSNVEGRIAPGKDAIDALRAGFPAGTLTGAPKVRAMEIIDELEREKRGLYGGAVGYISANGSMDTCIVLRTAVVKDGWMHVQAGGGVVADSDPQAEFQETVNKSMALIRAAEDASRFAPSGNLDS
jgi:anthranilate synthase component 1